MVNSGITKLLVVITIVSCIACGAAMVNRARCAAKATLCDANLFTIRHALLQYDALHGRLPPAFIAGTNGEPAHSWRTLIIPYLDSWGIDAEAFNKAYDFHRPWNSASNAALLKPRPEYRFACPCGSESDSAFTSYVVLMGDKTLFPGSHPVKLSAIPQSQDPILVVEITNSNIQWTEPRDLFVDTLRPDSTTNSIKLSRSHGGSFRYITVGGRTGTLPADTDLNEIRHLAELERP